jgi:predicted transposase/invertase (TIGR01784 family)
MNDLLHGVHLSNLRETHIIELPKLSNLPESDDLRNWLQFINARTTEDIVMLANTHPELQPVSQKLFRISTDKIAKEQYEARLKYSLDYNSGLVYARRQGKQEGLLLGKQEGLLLGEMKRAWSIAQNMRTRGRPLAEIAEFTGLSLSELSAEFSS